MCFFSSSFSDTCHSAISPTLDPQPVGSLHLQVSLLGEPGQGYFWPFTFHPGALTRGKFLRDAPRCPFTLSPFTLQFSSPPSSYSDSTWANPAPQRGRGGTSNPGLQRPHLPLLSFSVPGLLLMEKRVLQKMLGELLQPPLDKTCRQVCPPPNRSSFVLECGVSMLLFP